MPHSSVHKRFSRYPNKEASCIPNDFYRTSSSHCCPSSAPTFPSYDPFYEEDLRIDSPLRVRFWSRETSRRRYRIRGMQVRKRDVWIFSNSNFPSGDSPSCHEKADPCFSSIGILRNPSEALSRPGSPWYRVARRSSNDRAFLRPISVEENLIESRNRALISSLAYLRMLILRWKLERRGMCLHGELAE